MSKKKKVLRNILIIIAVFIAAAFSVNWLLTKRLEGFLKRELSIRTAKATDNFYDLSFDNLSISFFKGELRIEGIHLKPDSVTFNDWLMKDSLPDTYFIAHIGDIDFKGLNLTWRHNYKHLYFDTFAIKKPIIEVITPFSAYQDTTNSSSQKKRSENVKSKTLYEVISPYINILSVNAIALDSASAFFTVESNASPLVYGLENVSFNAYGFLLNEFSSDDGKLLYSDNFEFITNQPQVLFSNQDFKLETQQILLSTIDSVIRISDIHFYPEDKLWDNLKEKPEKSLNAFIADVEFDGIHFWRKNGLNHLAVRSFEIIKPDINITNLSGGKKKSGKIVRGDPFTNDSLVQNISLYTMISPVLNSVSIQEVAIEEAKMNYDWLSGDSINQFQLNDFNLQAQQFHVDSLSEISHNFFYSKNFMMRAHDISLLMKHENQKMKIDRIFLDSDEGDLLFSGISVIPLSTIKPGIYVSGAIDTLGFLGVNYDKGITMRSIKLEKPDIQLLLSGSKPSKSDKTARQKSSMSVSVGEILNPMFRFIQIHDIEIDQISLTIDDRISTVPAKYQLDKFDFFVTDFIINSQTVQHEPFFFDYKNIGFRFSDFDNLILNNSYRLRIANAEFSTLKGMLEFNQINFETVTTDLKSTLNFTTPYLQFKGLNNLPEYPIKNLQFSNFLIQSPCLNYQEITGLKLDLKLNEFSVDSFLWGSESLNLGTINLRYPVVAFTAAKPKFNDDPKNETKKENPDAVYLALKRIADQIDLRQLSLTDASVAFDYYNKKYELNSFSFSPINF